MARKKRKGEYICECSAYRFPHRFGGGRCTGVFLVQNHWEEYYGGSTECRACPIREYWGCPILEGVEQPQHCMVWQEFVRVNEIRLLGGYWK